MSLYCWVLKAIRLGVVVGAGSLQAISGVRLVDTPEFRAAYTAEAPATGGALEALYAVDDAVELAYR